MKEGETGKSGEIRKLREETAVGVMFFLKICQGICMALKRNLNPKSKFHILHFTCSPFIHLNGFGVS